LSGNYRDTRLQTNANLLTALSNFTPKYKSIVEVESGKNVGENVRNVCA